MPDNSLPPGAKAKKAGGRVSDQTRRHLPKFSAEFYGLHQTQAGPPRSTTDGWMVIFRRHRRKIDRFFSDVAYGSADQARQQAIAYRDIVLAALPPMTKRQVMVVPRVNNNGGIVGVARTDNKAGLNWIASIRADGIQKRRSFSIRLYGEERAKQMAVRQRRRWLAELKPEFVVYDAHAKTMARRHFAWQSEHVVDAFDTQGLICDADITARLAEIDARFDAERPPRLSIRVKEYTPGILAVFVSDCGSPVRSKLRTVKASRQELAATLLKVGSKIITAITEFHGAGVADWFMGEHGRQLLNPATFDRLVGIHVGLMVPPEIVSTRSVDRLERECREA